MSTSFFRRRIAPLLFCFCFCPGSLVFAQVSGQMSVLAQMNCKYLLNPSELRPVLGEVRRVLNSVVLGQSEVVDQILVAILIRGHLLIESSPGTGKTRLANALAKVFGASYTRIQFTSDIMPSNILGYSAKDRITQIEKFIPGPIFTDFLLADELNRGPSKAQSAFLQALEERAVTINGETRPLPNNFFSIATQNSTDQIGTNPLPEAQYDRFTMRILMEHPRGEVRAQISSMAMEERLGFSSLSAKVPALLAQADLNSIFRELKTISIDPSVLSYAIDLFDAIQEPIKIGLVELASLRKDGISPRGLTDLLLAAKVLAWLDGRQKVQLGDLKKYLHPILAHRLQLTPMAKAEGITQSELLERFILGLERYKRMHIE